MADERIDIEITDKVDASIPKKLREIASEAEKGANHLTRLQANLAAVNSSPATRLATAANAATNALARQTSAQARLLNAETRAASLASKLAAGKNQMAAAVAKETSAQKAATAGVQQDSHVRTRAALLQTQQWEARMAQLHAERAGLRAQNAAHFQEAQARLANTQKASIALGVKRQEAAATAAATAAKQAETIAVATNTTVTNTNTVATSRMTAAKAAAARVSRALTTELTGSSIASSTLGSAIQTGTLGLARFIPAAAASALLLNSFNKTANDTAPLRAYADTLGLTAKELKELEDVHVTFGDTAMAVWQTLAATTLEAMGLTTSEVSAMWDRSMEFVLKVVKFAFIGIGALAVTLVKTLGLIMLNTGKIFYNAGRAAANLFLLSIEFLVNKTIDGVNAIGSAINALSGAAGFGDVVGQLDKINLGISDANQGTMALTNIDIGGMFNEAARTAEGNLDRISKAIVATSQNIAANRLDGQAASIIERRSAGRAGGAASPRQTDDPSIALAERRAHALAQVNLQLDNELSRMGMLADARAVEQRLDQVTEALAQKRITLTDAESTALRAKIVEIERFTHVQGEMDRIVEASIAPRRTLNAALEAASLLLSRGAIDQATYNQEIEKANRAFNEATDPLFRMNEQLDSARMLTGLYGQALERANFLEGVRQEYAQRGIPLYDAQTGALNREVAAIVAKNNALLQQQFIQSQLGGLLNPILAQEQEIASETALYTELQRLRNDDLISEEAYQRAKYALAVKFDEMRLNAASDFFGALANATKGGYGVIGAISKAAAVAEATIQGYLAVQKALASAPPPLNYVAAAAVAIRTGSNVAGILSTNVGSFNTGGQFTVGGRAGVDRNNINMNVTRGERVTVETRQQQRANDNAGAGAAPVVDARTKVVNLFDEKEFIAAMDSEEGERVVMNIIRRNPSGISAAIAS